MKTKDKRGIFVKVNDKDNIDKALKKFKRKVKDSGLMLELKNREYFKKPSREKREANKKSLLRMRRQTINNNK